MGFISKTERLEPTLLTVGRLGREFLVVRVDAFGLVLTPFLNSVF